MQGIEIHCPYICVVTLLFSSAECWHWNIVYVFVNSRRRVPSDPTKRHRQLFNSRNFNGGVRAVPPPSPKGFQEPKPFVATKSPQRLPSGVIPVPRCSVLERQATRSYIPLHPHDNEREGSGTHLPPCEGSTPPGIVGGGGGDGKLSGGSCRSCPVGWLV